LAVAVFQEIKARTGNIHRDGVPVRASQRDELRGQRARRGPLRESAQPKR
jgi:hypothetical protein